MNANARELSSRLIAFLPSCPGFSQQRCNILPRHVIKKCHRFWGSDFCCSLSHEKAKGTEAGEAGEAGEGRERRAGAGPCMQRQPTGSQNALPAAWWKQFIPSSPSLSPALDEASASCFFFFFSLHGHTWAGDLSLTESSITSPLAGCHGSAQRHKPLDIRLEHRASFSIPLSPPSLSLFSITPWPFLSFCLALLPPAPHHTTPSLSLSLSPQSGDDPGVPS